MIEYVTGEGRGEYSEKGCVCNGEAGFGADRGDGYENGYGYGGGSGLFGYGQGYGCGDGSGSGDALGVGIGNG